jgi:hypothetical protein
MMGAKIGRRVYWPGSGIFCQDPELLEIGNDVGQLSIPTVVYLTEQSIGCIWFSFGTLHNR